MHYLYMHRCVKNFDGHVWKKFAIVQNNLHFLPYFNSSCINDQSPLLKLVLRFYVHFSLLYLILSQLSDSGIFSYF